MVTIEQVIERFASISPQRELITKKLVKVLNLAKSTNKLSRFIIFGSYITSKLAPNDVDIILVMADDFNIMECNEQTIVLFDHRVAQEKLGSSVFWVRPSLLILETIDQFISHWQVKRDKTHRGIVEIIL
ncbi:MAG: hypothetical protein WAQ98_17595 [Blastocatellia bacterium]